MNITVTGATIITIFNLIHCMGANTCEDNYSARGRQSWLMASTILQTSDTANPFQTVSAEKDRSFDPLAHIIGRAIPKETRLNIPFTAQAPRQNWNPPYNEACEEASLIMAEYYLRGQTLTPQTADRAIQYLINKETEKGWGIDISALQTGMLAKSLFNRNYKIYQGITVTKNNIKLLLSADYPVIVPVAGRELNNPNFRGNGPPYHMIVLTGYDKDNFYAHDPGTKFGMHYKYPQQTLLDAIHEWTGSKSTVKEGQKTILIIQDGQINNYVAAYGF